MFPRLCLDRAEKVSSWALPWCKRFCRSQYKKKKVWCQGRAKDSRESKKTNKFPARTGQAYRLAENDKKVLMSVGSRGGDNQQGTSWSRSRSAGRKDEAILAVAFEQPGLAVTRKHVKNLLDEERRANTSLGLPWGWQLLEPGNAGSPLDWAV
jgi:hypothetical protein